MLRLQSHYFALATLALASLINLVAVHAESLTGGANGLVGFAHRTAARARPAGAGLALPDRRRCWPTPPLRGPMGEKARLLREAPLVAATLGIDGAAVALPAFVVGGACAGLAGALLRGAERRRVAGSDRLFGHAALPHLGGAGRLASSDGRGRGRRLAVGLPELLRDLQGAGCSPMPSPTLAVVLWAPEGLAGLIDRLRGARRAPAVPPGLPRRYRLCPVRSG